MCQQEECFFARRGIGPGFDSSDAGTRESCHDHDEHCVNDIVLDHSLVDCCIVMFW